MRSLLLLALLGSACDEPPAPEATTPETSSPEEEDERPDPLAHVSSGRQRGRPIGPATELRTGDAPMPLDLREGARVSLDPQSLARIDDESRAQIVLARGALHAVLPPMGGSPRPPLRIGTAAASLEIGGSGEAFVVALPDGSAWFAMLSGSGHVSTGEGERVLLTPGRALAGGATETTEGPTELDAARAIAATLPTADADPEAEVMAPAVARLDAAITAGTQVRDQGASLQRRHAQAVSAMSGASEVMQEIVAHTRALESVRASLLVAYERARALALLTGASPDPTAIRRPRVRAILGRDAEPEEQSSP